MRRGDVNPFEEFKPCRLVWPCGQYRGASTTCQVVCAWCWNRLLAIGDLVREMQANYASGIADTYGPKGLR